jgi:phosphopantetheine adenylyltransferase
LGATPPFDPFDAGHADVVAKTKNLLMQWNADMVANPGVFQKLLDPNKSLPSRRRALRERLKILPGYADYDLACRSLYAV